MFYRYGLWYTPIFELQLCVLESCTSFHINLPLQLYSMPYSGSRTLYNVTFEYIPNFSYVELFSLLEHIGRMLCGDIIFFIVGSSICMLQWPDLYSVRCNQSEITGG
jgi:hypothetical protein